MAVKFLKKAFDTFMDLLCPSGVACLLCGKEIKEGSLCADCEKSLKVNSRNRCVKCSRPTVSIEDELCEQCKAMAHVYYDSCVAPLIYSGTALALMRAFKYHDRIDIADYFVDFLEKEYYALEKPDLIIPVPLWEKKLVDRVYSSADVLSENLAKRTGAKLNKSICRKIKDTGTQTVLTPEERAKNVKGCFEVTDKEAVKGKSILIVDDVFTTGATVSELAKVLKKKGASKVRVLCVAIAVTK